MQKVIPHDLPKDKAKRVIDKAVATYTEDAAQYSPDFKWVNDSTAKLTLTVMRKQITADIKLNDKDVTLDVTVPPAFKIFEKKALSLVDEEVQKWLRKAKKGEI